MKIKTQSTAKKVGNQNMLGTFNLRRKEDVLLGYTINFKPKMMSQIFGFSFMNHVIHLFYSIVWFLFIYRFYTYRLDGLPHKRNIRIQNFNNLST